MEQPEDDLVLPQRTEATPLLDLRPLSKYEQAAWIVDETIRGIPVDESALPRSTEESQQYRKAHLRFDNYLVLRQLACLALLVLTFFEAPAWCGREARCEVMGPDGQPADVFLSGVPFLPARAASLVEIALLVFLLGALLHQRRLTAFSRHGQRNPIVSYHTMAVGLLCADALFALAVPNPPFRISPYIRAVLPLFYWPSLLNMAAGIRAVLVPFVDVTTFWAIFTVSCGWFFTLLFHDIPAADRYFGDLPTGIYSSFTSVTGADWPMQVMAVLDASRPSAIVFLAFIVVGIFILFNMILAVVYNGFTEHVESKVVENATRRYNNLQLAYRLLCSDASETLSMHEFKPLVATLCKNQHFTHVNQSHIDLIFVALDDDSDAQISETEFMDLLEVLELQFEELSTSKTTSYLETAFPSLSRNVPYKQLMAYVRSTSFERLVDVIMLLNVMIIWIETTMDLKNTDTPQSVLVFAYLEIGFSFVYICEMLLKTAAMSFRRYWSIAGNRFDFIVTILLLLGGAYIILPYGENDPQLIRYLVCLRCLRLIALLADIPRFRNLARVFGVLVPASAPLFSIFGLSLFFFSALGVHLFGGLIYSSNPALNPTNNRLVDAFVGNDYWTLNCNDMAATFFMLFSSVVVCYLTEVPAAIAATSRFGNWTYWYFIASFAVNTLIVSNVVIALVVDLFVDTGESLRDDSDEAQALAELKRRYGARRVRVNKARQTADHVFASMFREKVQALASMRE